MSDRLGRGRTGPDGGLWRPRRPICCSRARGGGDIVWVNHGGHGLADGLHEAADLGQLASLLRALRRRHGRQRGDTPLTYRELAARTGWAHGIIGDYLTGKRLPPTDRFDELVRLLGATAVEQ